MKAIIVGSGTAVPDPVRGNASAAVVVDDEVLLFDCGERTTVNLTKAGINPLTVSHLFFTHLHCDHCSDYGYFVITSWSCGRKKLLRVYGPRGTRDMSEATIFGANKAHVDFTRYFITTLPEHIKDRPLESPPVVAEDIEAGFTLETDRFKLTTARVDHVGDTILPSIAYRVDSDYGSVAISGDTGPCDAMIELARGVDLLIHESAFLDEIIEAREMRGHSGPTAVGKIAAAAGVKKLVITHLGPYDSPPAAVEMASMYYGPRRGPQTWSHILDCVGKHYGGAVMLAEDALVLQVGQTTQ